MTKQELQQRIQAETVRERQEELAFLLSDPSGRRFVARLFASCGLNAHTIVTRDTGRTDATIWLEGRRSVAVDLLEEILRRDPQAFTEITREAMAHLAQQQELARLVRDEEV